MNRSILTLVLSAALTAAPVAADELNIEAGVIGVSDTSARFGKYTGLDQQGGYLQANLDLYTWSDNARYLEVIGTNLGLDSRFLGVETGKPGVWDVYAYYDQLPRYVFDDTATPFSGVGSNSLTLPASWVPAPTTQGMTELDATLRPQSIDQERQTLGAGIDVTPWKRLTLTADYRRTELDGNRLQPGAFLYSSTELLQPIDYTTDELQFGIGYGGKAWNAELSYLGSFFRNDDDAYAWDNPYTSGGVDRGAQSQPPENDFQQVAVSGGWRGPKRTTVNGRVAAGRMTQDAQFLPYTINPNLTPQPLPAANLDGEVDTLNVFLRATSSPWRRLRLNAEYRLDDRSNDTPVNTYDYVLTDVVPGLSAVNQPYGYKRTTYGLDGDLRLGGGLRLAAGWDRKETDRTLQEREETEADRFWGRLRLRPGGAIDMSLLLAAENRDGSEYVPLTTGASQQNPLMRKYYMADRDRNEIELRLGWLATDALNLSFQSRYARDEYDASQIGLREASDLSFTLDGSLDIGNGGVVYAAYTRETIESELANSQNFSAADWVGEAKDEFNTVVLGINVAELTDQLSLDIGYTFSQSSGDVATLITNSTQGGPFPELETRLHSVRLTLDYDWRDTTTFRVGYWFESYRTEDWSLEGVEPATVPNLLALGANPFRYDVSTIMLSFVYRAR